MIKRCLRWLGLALGIYWWLTKLGGRKDELRAWRGHYAHRGLHSQNKPENTRAAFEAAIEVGYGFEFDVQLSGDGQLVVHHDFDGLRSMGLDQRIESLSLTELQQYRLFESDQVIMTLPELLELVDGQVPLILEIKAEKNTATVSQAVADVIRDYPGELVIESFHPLVLWWFRRYRPQYLRGQLAYNAWKHSGPSLSHFILTHYLLNFLARPHFVAHSFGDRQDFSFKLLQWLHSPPSVVYTTKSPREDQMARTQFSTIIFEDYQPKPWVQE